MAREGASSTAGIRSAAGGQGARSARSIHDIVTGQTVNPARVEFAKALRRELTVEERILWQQLRGSRLEKLHFRRQQIVDGYIVDFYCHAARLVVEVDGRVHERHVEADAYREHTLAARGLRVLRVTNDDVLHSLPGVLRRIAAVAAEQVQRP